MWTDTYLGPPDIITHDAGTQFNTDDFRAAGVSTVRPSLAFPDARVILEVAFASALHIRGLGRATLAIPLMSRR